MFDGWFSFWNLVFETADKYAIWMKGILYQALWLIEAIKVNYISTNIITTIDCKVVSSHLKAAKYF